MRVSKTSLGFSAFIGASLCVGMLLIGNGRLALAGEQKEAPEPLALKGIMQQLAVDMSQIVSSVAYGDWQQVATAAERVAEHPKPPLTEKMRIMSFIGSDATDFKAFDSKVHDGAVELAKAARHENESKALKAFSRVQKNCVGCHQAFRERFQAHFYGN